jgi:hypothetical protein
MFNFLGVLGVGYLAATGLATNMAVVGRGLARAARSAASGNISEAVVETLGAMVAPVAMTCVATAALVTEVLSGAEELVMPVMQEQEQVSNRQAA